MSLCTSFMTMSYSKSQIDKLGERLKSDQSNEADLRKLDEYRRSFTTAFDLVEQRIHQGIQRPVSGRRAKSTSSIVEKLKRESVRLSQVQDIAGCRLVVSNIIDQDRTVSSSSRCRAV